MQVYLNSTSTCCRKGKNSLGAMQKSSTEASTELPRFNSHHVAMWLDLYRVGMPIAVDSTAAHTCNV